MAENEKKDLIKSDYYPKSALQYVYPINQLELKQLIDELRLRGYSRNTIKTYSGEFTQLLYLLKNYPVKSLPPEKLRSYLLYCVEVLKLSENQIHSRLNAIKFYFEKVLKREKFFAEIPRPKKRQILPKALSKEEVKKLFSVIRNPKHLLIMKLCYGMGLRVSEIVNLKIADIDSSRMLVLIESAKGKKDRYVPLPESVLTEMRQYYLLYKPRIYLFEGQYGDAYSKRSVQAVFKTAMRKANIHKAIGMHGLRHSYATHLMEAGTDMALIQKLLGHQNIKTTEIYAKISFKEVVKVRSPLDSMEL
ncbi:site-specific integrase [Bacteroidales bacterium OttesenSCG-928-B11]|nr:site-specific integrase [Bacteroidales bacterium OttesenSCG-928-E04]MDL2309354.1 site-specific integrase [Bacteroidales bacterium OttesenSCG-928-C03]MDL2313154.1 site-specific integrase [Bacteroidales bacterium OttesenSCG-928-B11]